jgi:putative ABC transport system substrate-binding protein
LLAACYLLAMSPPARSRLPAALLLLVGLASLPPPDAAAQTAKRFRIGVLNTAFAANSPMVEGLRAGLKQLDLEEGRDVSFDVRFTRGDVKALSGAAEALAKAPVDLIFANGNAAARAAKDATSTIPIVFAVVPDPVAVGLVKDLAKPDVNLTGVSSLTTDLVPKRLEILKALAPAVGRVLAVYHPDDAASRAAVEKAKAVAAEYKVAVLDRAVRSPADVERVMRELRPGDGLLPPDLGSLAIPGRMLELSRAQKIPAVFPTMLWIEQGALASYGSDPYEQGIQAAGIVAKILKGAKPGEVPVEGARKLVLAINKATAGALGLRVPDELLERADRVVE